MKKITLSIIALFILFIGTVSAQTKEHPGKKVFVDSKCQTCHTVESHELTSKSKKAVDLSNVGGVYRANFLEQFLVKKEKINNKMHVQAFKGSNDDLHNLAEWLQTLNTGSEKSADTTGNKK